MRIGMVVPDLLEAGGLEKIATEVAAALQANGQRVCVMSTGWAAPDNQYRVYLRQQGVPFFQAPRWLFLAAADWGTKERLLAWTLTVCWPLIAGAALMLMLVRRKPWRAALASARGWLSQQLLGRLIGPNRRHSLARLLLAWWRWRWRPDVLHLQGYTSTLLFVLDWAAARRVPVVYTENQTPDPRFDWWQGFNRSINKATVVVAASDTSARALRAICDIQRPLVTFLPAVADPVAQGHSVALRPVPSGAPLNVSTIARLSVTKGLTYLLETIAQVRRAFPTTRFHVYGDGPLRDELLAYASQLGLPGEDIFVGTFSQAELPRIMSDTDIVLMSSVLEGLPLALVEAMAYGRPIVATLVGGNAEVIADGVSGLLCPPRDPGCLSRKLASLLADGGLRARLGQAARQAYEHSDFTPAVVAQHHIAIYEQALAIFNQPAIGRSK
jgi:glycosyltransferase involved in cell wall biosynthesis